MHAVCWYVATSVRAYWASGPISGYVSAKHLRARAVIILFFAGVGIGIKECQRNILIPSPDSDPAPLISLIAEVGAGI